MSGLGRVSPGPASLVLAACLTWAMGAGGTAAEGTSGSSADAEAWTVYHGDAAGSGASSSKTPVDTSAPKWTSPTLDGQLYGEPLVASGRVYVATENDTVYALSSSNGAVEWSAHLGTPVPAASLPCGDIAPTVGITGTPVIDQSRREIFVVADELVRGTPEHLLVGLNIDTGAVELTQLVDPPGAGPAALLQRTGLTLDAGQVVFGLGGNYGDCSSYRGRVVAVDEAGGTPALFTVDAAAGDREGAVWMGGAAPAVDSSGDIWVSVGNGSVTSASAPYDNSDSALELSSSLKLLQYFAPSTWAADNASDLDMSMAPALLPDGQVVAAGKSRIAYLLNGADLGGIGAQETSLGSVCDNDIDGGAAVVGDTVYLPCLSGTVALGVAASPPALRILWRSGQGGGPPIVAAGLVWTIGQNGTLYGLDASTGATVQQASIGGPANHFPTPSIGDGLLLAASASQVVAFAATPKANPTTSTTTAPTQPGASTTAPGQHPSGASPSGTAGGGPGPGIIAAIVAGTLALGGVTWLVTRWRRARVRPPPQRS